MRRRAGLVCLGPALTGAWLGADSADGNAKPALKGIRSPTKLTPCKNVRMKRLRMMLKSGKATENALYGSDSPLTAVSQPGSLTLDTSDAPKGNPSGKLVSWRLLHTRLMGVRLYLWPELSRKVVPFAAAKAKAKAQSEFKPLEAVSSRVRKPLRLPSRAADSECESKEKRHRPSRRLASKRERERGFSRVWL